MKIFKKIFAASTAFIIFLVAFLFSGCGATAKAHDMIGYFGTQSTAVIYADYGSGDSAKTEEAIAEIEKVFTEIDKAVSLAYDDSDISRFNAANAGLAVEITRTTYELLVEAKRLYVYTEGAYNPAIGMLADLWGFTPRFNDADYALAMPYDRASATALPEQKYIDAFTTLTDFSGVTLKTMENKYYAVKPEITANVDGDNNIYTIALDLGGIGKGFAADKARAILEKYGFTDAYISVGTSSLALLAHPKGSDGAPEENMWKVSLTHPRGDVPYLSVYAKDIAASTSGDYEHSYIIEGVNYCHIIDPTTGRPIQNGTATVSLFGRTAAEGDAITTALCVMGRDKAVEFINEKLTDCRVAMVSANNGKYGFITNMQSNYYKLNSLDFPLISQEKDGKITHVG